MLILRSLRSLLPFILAIIGFTLIALVINMPVFEWQISDIATDLPAGVQINSSWTTKFGDSLMDGSYNANDGSYIFHQVLFSSNGNSCSAEQLTSVVKRSQSDETLEQMALNVNHEIVLWMTGLTQTGQITMTVFLFLCGVYIWWFTISDNRPIAEALILTVIAVVLLGLLINVWRILVPETGVFVCRPWIHGSVTFNAKLSKVHYETLIVLFIGIVAELGAVGVMLHKVVQVIFQKNKATN
jgi:hypothetical protein